MEFADDDIAMIAHEVFEQMLGLECRPAPPPGLPVQGGAMTGNVHVSGDWSGTITLDCSLPLARVAAAAMFMVKVEELSDDEVQDAVGELTNMTGGNVKNLVEGSCRLSLPAVIEGGTFLDRTVGATVTNRLDFACCEQPLRISVLERT